MIEVKEKVRHNGISYRDGDRIEDITVNEAERLVQSNVAFFIGDQQVSIQNGSDDGEDNNDPVNYNEELDAISYADLKEIGDELDLDFPGNISKVNLVSLIVENDKAEEALSMTEEE